MGSPTPTPARLWRGRLRAWYRSGWTGPEVAGVQVAILARMAGAGNGRAAIAVARTDSRALQSRHVPRFPRPLAATAETLSVPRPQPVDRQVGTRAVRCRTHRVRGAVPGRGNRQAARDSDRGRIVQSLARTSSGDDEGAAALLLWVVRRGASADAKVSKKFTPRNESRGTCVLSICINMHIFVASALLKRRPS